MIPANTSWPAPSQLHRFDEYTAELVDKRWVLIDHQALVTALAYQPSDNVVEDNRRRLSLGLPMVRRGRWSST